MVKNIASNGTVSDGPVGTMVSGYTILMADSLDAPEVADEHVARFAGHVQIHNDQAGTRAAVASSALATLNAERTV